MTKQNSDPPAEAGHRTESDSSVSDLLVLLQQFTLETDRFVGGLGARHALHRTDLNALAVVVEAARRGQPATPGQLGQALNLSSPATTALIDRLDRAGHLHRRRSTVDRRRVELEATPLALQVGSTLFAPLAKHVGAVIETYTPEEQQLLRRFLREAIAATTSAKEETAG